MNDSEFTLEDIVALIIFDNEKILNRKGFSSELVNTDSLKTLIGQIKNQLNELKHNDTPDSKISEYVPAYLMNQVLDNYLKD